jgi:hypothetical protein
VLTPAGSAMAKMLCCGGEKDTSRDLKSAQNTPSRQPGVGGTGAQNMQPYATAAGQAAVPGQQQGRIDRDSCQKGENHYMCF